MKKKKKIERKSYEEGHHSPLMVIHERQPCLCMCVF